MAAFTSSSSSSTASEISGTPICRTSRIGVKQKADDWTVEIALPISLFDYTSPLEVNVCFSDLPSGKHYALYPTGASFHNRKAFQTLFLK